MLDAVFLLCFLFGLIFSAVSFALGSLGAVHLSAGHAAGPNGHVPPLGHGHAVPVVPGHAPAPAHPAGGPRFLDRLPIFSFSAILAFLVAFGGIGYLLTHYVGFSALPALIVAIPAGIAGDALIALLLGALLRGEHVLQPEDFRLEGVIAEVSVGIGPNGVGEVIYSRSGRRWSEAARAADGQAIARGTKVVIVRYEHGIAFVQPWNDFVKDKAPDLIET